MPDCIPQDEEWPKFYLCDELNEMGDYHYDEQGYDVPEQLLMRRRCMSDSEQ